MTSDPPLARAATLVVAVLLGVLIHPAFSAFFLLLWHRRTVSDALRSPKWTSLVR